MPDRNIKYDTQNLALAAAIHSKGCTLVDYSYNDINNIVTFTFDNPIECKEYEKQWFANNLEVKAFENHLSLRLLKGVLHAER